MLMAWSFCALNGYLQARYLTHLHAYPAAWVYDLRFVVGLLIWLAGFALNLHSDGILRALRKPGDTVRTNSLRPVSFWHVLSSDFL